MSPRDFLRWQSAAVTTGVYKIGYGPISHNLTTVTDVDQIIYLHHGRITETGTHHQLLARNGGYAHLYRTQLNRDHAAQTQPADTDPTHHYRAPTSPGRHRALEVSPVPA
ncbi:MAG: hypothetical protein ACRDQ6_10855 [Pseudonocardiaceae bacterium]